MLIENFKVGTLAKYRLGYESLKGVNPQLIYCSISAFGQDGPAADEPGYDAMIQAISGLMSVTGVPDGEPGAGPVKVGVAVSDLITGLYAVDRDPRGAASSANSPAAASTSTSRCSTRRSRRSRTRRSTTS